MFGLIRLVNEMKKVFISNSEKETKVLAEKIASIAHKGDVFALYGTLGIGKSVFSRAFIQKLTMVDDVPSPTFTLVQEYNAKDFNIYHFDLYRLKHADEVFELGFEDAIYNGVSLIEWPEKAGTWLPKDIFNIEIEPHTKGRKITITVSSEEKASRLCVI